MADDQNSTTDPRDQQMDKLANEIHRLRNALDKIIRGYPCSTVLDMKRMAAEALGVKRSESDTDV